MDREATLPGSRRMIKGEERVFYDGYWIKYYAPPADTLTAKKQLITALTRRLFNHVEHGINIPGSKLNDARSCYEEETDPNLKRVKGAMLAGSLFNRATDIITKLVEIQALGVEISSDNGLLRECGRCLQEALGLGRLVLHRSGEEGIDELWGEPLHAFSIPVEAFYESRYIKIASTMRDVDRIGQALTKTFMSERAYDGIQPLIEAVNKTAHLKVETLQTDNAIFTVWPNFVVASERLLAFRPQAKDNASLEYNRLQDEGVRLISQGQSIISDIIRARTPMPKTTREYITRLDSYREKVIREAARHSD
ncbi:MAG: hypothetical protein B7Z60_02865 [Ferrovum sp. 37-45-19]|jgi:hypothetical protein|nr:MAG: hypothetical protein B7Z65_00935 [Ferrovum sp. 21-44-67]OYV94758.1 MAG: hypothetical protein B7Z60_02865 [Ferrovum sp. 37-45-19]OZB31898.1 MAG: hypothetical protein B7X47_08155 [Ferrovum sp. 34-44-207]HQT81123.1 hypothetical protein [Ferrovaceae bacterium]HQU06060.1 hypothetical protein [Ferrovaceae bacterium]